jgi:hypothetical protein
MMAADDYVAMSLDPGERMARAPERVDHGQLIQVKKICGRLG